MAKVDRSILLANDQNMGDFGDPNKLEASISHLADKIDSNDTETQNLKTENNSVKGRVSALEGDVSALKTDNASNKTRISENENDIAYNEGRLNELLRNNQQASEVVDARMGFPVLREKLENVDAQLAGNGQYSDILTPVGYTRFIGHRGLSAVAPEGTLPAILMASELGLWSAEGDAQITADGEWVVFHDSTVDRMTNGTGNVKDFTLSQLTALNIDNGNNIAYYPGLKIPTLKEYLLTCKQYNVVPCIEIKSDTYEPTYTPQQYDSFVRIVKECGLENKIIIQGSEPLCTQIRNRSKAIPLMLFTTFASLNAWAGSYIQNAGNMIMNTDNAYVTSKADVELAHSMGIPVSVFVVDDVNRALELQSWGVDFIMTNVLTGGGQ